MANPENSTQDPQAEAGPSDGNSPARDPDAAVEERKLTFTLTFVIPTAKLQDLMGATDISTASPWTLPIYKGTMTVKRGATETHQDWTGAEIANASVALTTLGKKLLQEALSDNGPIEPFPVGGGMPDPANPGSNTDTFNITDSKTA